MIIDVVNSTQIIILYVHNYSATQNVALRVTMVKHSLSHLFFEFASLTKNKQKYSCKQQSGASHYCAAALRKQCTMCI